MTLEKRLHKRIPIKLEVYWEKGSGKQLVRLEDISVSGCLIGALTLPNIGQNVNLEIRLPAGRWMPLRCTVVRHHPHKGFGVRFDSLSEREQCLLGELIDSLDKKG